MFLCWVQNEEHQTITISSIKKESAESIWLYAQLSLVFWGSMMFSLQVKYGSNFAL